MKKQWNTNYADNNNEYTDIRIIINDNINNHDNNEYTSKIIIIMIILTIMIITMILR